MPWITSDPFLLVALIAVIGWFLTAGYFLWTKGQKLAKDIASFAAAVSQSAVASDDAGLDAAVPTGSELPVAWRRIRAARFASVSGRLVLASDPIDLVSSEDLLEPTKWYRFCSATPNYLVGLGLGFTFLGLVLALGSIDAQNLSDPAQLTRLFAAMKFKFIASMMGIFSSIFFSLLLRMYLSKLQHRVAELQAALASRYPVVDPVVNAIGALINRVDVVETRVKESTTLAARTADATERSLDIWGDVVDQLKTAATQLKKFNDELSISIGNVLEERFEQKLLPPINEALKSVERAINGVRDAQTSADSQLMTGVVDEFRKAVTGGASTEVAAIAATLTQLNDSLSATKTDFQGIGKTIESDIVAGLRGATGQLSDSIETLSRKLADALTTASGSLTARLDTATADAGNRFTTAVDRLDLLLQQARGTVDAGTTSAQSTERILARFSDIAEKLDQAQIAFGRVADPVQRASERLDAVAERVRQAVEAIQRSAEHTESIQERVSASWTQASQRFEGVDQELAKIFSSLHDGLTSYAATVNEFNGSLTREFNRALGSLQGIVGELDETLQALQSQVSKVP